MLGQIASEVERWCVGEETTTLDAVRYLVADWMVMRGTLDKINIEKRYSDGPVAPRGVTEKDVIEQLKLRPILEKIVTRNYIAAQDPVGSDGAQQYGGRWVIPVHGCDALTSLIDDVECDVRRSVNRSFGKQVIV